MPLKSVALLLLALGAALRAGAAPTITEPAGADTNYRVTAPAYAATVAADGCLTSFKAGGVEYLLPGVDVSRGVYLYAGGAAKLPRISRPAPGVILAEGDAGSLRYEFSDAGLTITGANSGKAPVPLFVAVAPAVKDILPDGGKMETLPVTENTTAADWFGGTAKVRIAGDDRLWGPWAGGAQVIEADIAPGATRTLTWTVAAATPDDLARMQAGAGPDPLARPGFAVLSPQDYEVFQRRTRLQGAVRVAGSLASPGDRVEVRLTGTPLQGGLPGTWQAVTTDAGGAFSGVIPAPAGGWYGLEVRDTHADHTTDVTKIAHVGVGEVFVGAGQSNSTNFGQAPQKETSGMVATFSGSDWRLADDPQPGVHDNSKGGSFWPSFGDALYARYHVPIGVAPTGFGGTSVLQWQPGGDLFNFTLARIHALGPQGFRALLWHQGEADSGGPLTAEAYARDLARVIEASRAEAGWDFPWFVAQVSYHDPTANSYPNTRDGQKMLWDLGLALPGPDTDTLTGADRFGIHLSPQGLAHHGRLWADQVGPYLDKVLARPGH